MAAPRRLIRRRPRAYLLGMRFWAVALIAACLAGLPASAQQAVPENREQITLSFATLVRAAAPAVVNVFTSRLVRQRTVSPLFDDPFFQRFFGREFAGPERERQENSLGSGVIVRSDGLIVTNHHVIEGADEVKVVLADRREFTAEVVRTDERTDLAILKIENGDSGFPFLELADSDELAVGDLVLAIGNPFGVGQTVTSGIISALARTNVGVTDFNFFIQTDAAINPGNSGGALLRMDGKLAGVNTAIFSRSGGDQGIGFAIPANMVRTVIASAETGGSLLRPWLGASGQDVTPDIAEALGLDRPAGVVIGEVHPNGPAERAGLQTGDVIVGMDGQPVFDQDALRFRLAIGEVGGAAEVTVLRNNRELAVVIPREPPPEVPPRDQTALSGRHPLAGATVANLSPAVAVERGLNAGLSGVLVIDVAPSSPAQRIGLREHDIVVEVNGARPQTVAELRDVVSEPAPRWSISIRRDDRVLSVTVTG